MGIGLRPGPGLAAQARRDGPGDVADQPVAESATHGDEEAIALRRCEVRRELAPPVGDQIGPAVELIVIQSGG
jgi:hypothetical protein